MLNGRGAVVFVRLHQVGTGQKFVGGINALEIFAGDIHKFGQPRAGTDKHGLEAVFIFQFLDGKNPADDHVGLYLDAQCLKVIHFLLHDGFGETEFGDTVNEHAARHVKRLENGDFIAHFRQIARAGEAGGARTDHGHLVPVGGYGGRFFRRVHIMIIGDKSFETADTHRFAARFDAARAFAFTLRLLRADAAADRGQRAGHRNNPIGFFKLAFRHFADKLGDSDIDGTARHAGTGFAV